MSQHLDLKAIEQKAFRSVHQDGLTDIYIGLLLLSMSLFFAVPESGKGESTYMILAALGVAFAFAIYQLGKKFITAPRLGQVQFGPERQKRKTALAWVMAFYVLITLGLFSYSLYVWKSGVSPTSTTNPSLMRVLVASLAALIAGTSVIIKSYFIEFVRGYYIALLMGCGLFLAIWLNSTLPIIIAGALILVPGLVLFVHFLRQHPLPPQEAIHDNS